MSYTKIRGRNVGVFRHNGTALEPFLCAMDSELEISVDMAEIANTSTGNGKAFKPGRYSWTVTLQKVRCATAETGKVTDSVLDAAILANTQFMLVFSGCTQNAATQSGGSYSDTYFEGAAYIREYRWTLPVNGVSSLSITFQGSGNLTFEPTIPNTL